MIASVGGSNSRPVLVTLPTVVRPEMTLEDLRRANVFFPDSPSAYSVLDLLDLIGAYNAAIRLVALKEGVPYIDLAHAFEQIEDPTPLFITTQGGAKRIADLLLRDLDRLGLLDRKASRASGAS